MPKDCLPPHLKDKLHWDWIWPLSRIPRSWTAWCWGRPKKIFGNQPVNENGIPLPIAPPGKWQFSYFPDAPLWAKPFSWYFSISTKANANGKYRNFRCGSRFDDVDFYTNSTLIPFPSSRVYTYGENEDTSTK